MSEPEWGESWDDWDGAGDYSFGPNGEFMDMSTMDVGWWNGADMFGTSTPSEDPPPSSPARSVTPIFEPEHMINERHFLLRIRRHECFVGVLDEVKAILNELYRNPPKGFTAAFFLDEIRQWKEFAEEADNLRGDIRILAQSNTKEAYNIHFIDYIKQETCKMEMYSFEMMIRSNDDELMEFMAEFMDHYIDLFEEFDDVDFTLDRLQTVVDVIKPDNPHCERFMPFNKVNPTCCFPRGGGLDSGIGLVERLRLNRHLRLYLDLIPADAERTRPIVPYEVNPYAEPPKKSKYMTTRELNNEYDDCSESEVIEGDLGEEGNPPPF